MNLKVNVLIFLDRSGIIIDRVRKFARKLCGYKLTYSLLFRETDREDDIATKDEIDHLNKLFKFHQSAMDTDYQLISRA